jgi:hypothetical protein
MLYAGLLLALAALLALSPAEATLGPVVRIVYLHGALERVSVWAFLAAALLGIGQLCVPRRRLGAWIQATIEIAILLWIAHYVVSLPAQILAWGGITLSEPRVASATWILIATLLIYLVVRWIVRAALQEMPLAQQTPAAPLDQTALWLAGGAILNAVVVFIVLRGAVNVLHPLNPIFSSDSPVMIGFYLAIMLVIAALACLITRDRAAMLEYYTLAVLED